MKHCVKCGINKQNSEFYHNKNNADKLSGKCKECYKEGVRENYRKNRDYYIKYEKERRKKPEWKIVREKFRGKYEEKYPERLAAKIILNHAIETGKIKKQPCQICSAKRVEAHHEDYTKPLDVDWLCNMHHRQKHNTSVI